MTPSTFNLRFKEFSGTFEDDYAFELRDTMDREEFRQRMDRLNRAVKFTSTEQFVFCALILAVFVVPGTLVFKMSDNRDMSEAMSRIIGTTLALFIMLAICAVVRDRKVKKVVASILTQYNLVDNSRGINWRTYKVETVYVRDNSFRTHSRLMLQIQVAPSENYLPVYQQPMRHQDLSEVQVPPTIFVEKNAPPEYEFQGGAFSSGQRP